MKKSTGDGGFEYTYKLSDPAYISSSAGTFGNTDYGQYALKEFFSYHKCNKYCDKFTRPNTDDIGAMEIDLDSVIGKANSTKTMTVAMANKEMLIGIGCNPENFKKVFKYLARFEVGSSLKKEMKNAIKEADAPEAEKNEAAAFLESLDFVL